MEKKFLPNEIKSERIILKRHSLELAEQMFRYVDQDRERLRQFLPWVDLTRTIEDEIDYIKMTQVQWEGYSLFDYGIFRRSDSLYMGNCGVHAIAWSHDRCELGYWILGAFEGQGFMSEAIRTLEKELFKIGFNRIEIRCASSNLRSANVPRANGYKHEGTLKEEAIENNQYRDTLVFAKLKSEYCDYNFDDQLRLEPIDLNQENILQDIYNHSPTYFRRVDGTDPLPGMAKKDIEDIPQNRSKTYKKIAALIYKESEPIGYADLHINHRTDGVAYLGLLLLKESEQGKGIGRKAYLLVEKYLSEKFNIKTIVLGVSDKNQVQAYWEKMGFKPNGCTYVWKGERVESNITEMEKSLEDQGKK